MLASLIIQLIAFQSYEDLKIVFFVLIGIVTLKIKISEIKSILDGLINSGKLTEHYEKFPETPAGFDEWVKEAEILWKKAGKLSDWKPEL